MIEGRELCICERAKRVSGSLTITVFRYFTKTASATILYSNKTAKMAFFNHAKRHRKRVRFQPTKECSASGSVATGLESYRFLQYREDGFQNPLFLNFKAIPVRYTTTTTTMSTSLNRGISTQETDFPDHASERKTSKLCIIG